jgi:hypothetical protein
MKSKIISGFIGGLLLLAITVIFACAHAPSTAARHPDIEEANPELCGQCHEDWRSSLSHEADFNTRHKFYAYQRQESCALCHRGAFCSDCHAHKEELKPSDKYKEYVTRDLPHRGDYLTQHQIDGRINPPLCFKCHGRQNNERCRICHRV